MEKVGKNILLNYYFSQDLRNGLILIEFFAFLDIYLGYFAYHIYIISQKIA